MASVTALGEAEVTSPPEPVPPNAEMIPPAEMVDFVIDLASPGKNRPQVSLIIYFCRQKRPFDAGLLRRPIQSLQSLCPLLEGLNEVVLTLRFF